MPDLMANQPDGSWSWSTSPSGNNTIGTRFQVSTAGNLTRCGFYRMGTGPAIRRLAIYAAPGTKLWEDVTPTDAGVSGWQWTEVTPAVAVTTGVTYTTAAGYADVDGRAYNLTPASRVAPPAPFLFDDVPAHHIGALDTYPSNALTDRYYGLNVTFESPSPVTPGPGEGDPTLTGDLHSWLSALGAVNTHQVDGLPWLTKEQVDAIKAAVDLIPKAADTNWTRLYEIWQFAGDLTDVQLGLWRAFMDRASSQLTGPTAGGGSAFHGPGGIPIGQAAEEILLATDKLWHRTQTTNWLLPVPGSEWLKADELTYTGPVGWNQEADVYVNRFTTWPATVDRQDIGDNIWLPRAAWWAPLTGTLPHERRFCDFDVQILHNLPLRSSGILLVPRGGYEGVIEAWIRPDV